MESIKTHIFCNIHPKETVQRICLDPYCERGILCIECIIGDSTGQSKEGHEKMVTLDDFIVSAGKFYEENFKKPDPDQKLPEHLVKTLSKEPEQLVKLSQHIESQKILVDSIIQELIKKFTTICNKKRDELRNLLDRQLIDFRFNYQFFEKQLKKNFASDNDESLFPGKEAITQKINACINGNQLFAFIKDIKTDFLEASRRKEEVARDINILKVLENLSDQLQKQASLLPTLIDPTDAASFDADSLLKEKTTKMFEEAFELEDEIFDLSLSFGQSLPNSRIVKKAQEAALLKRWVDPKKNISFKLLYSGHKDGWMAADFHKKCDGKVNTLTIILSNQGKVFGGFLDKAWNQSENYIITEKSWLFSLTSKEKYKLKSANSQYAGYGSASYGPTFGGGNNDLYLSGDFRTLSNGGSPLSYECSDTSKFMGGTTFQVKEIEVYQAVFEKQGKENTVEDKKSKNSKSASKILSSEQFGNVIDYVGENVGVDSVERIYQATKDGFSAAEFHKKCWHE